MPRWGVLVAACASALALLAACGQRPAPPAPERPASRLPVWRQVPDKPPGPAPAPVVGRRRSFALRTVARGLRAPVQVVARPGDPDRLYVAERGGRVRVIERGRLRRAPFLDLRGRVSKGGELGLLSIAFAPGGDRMYALLTDVAGDSRVVRFDAGPRSARRPSARTLLRVEQPHINHKGGTLLVDSRARLVLGLGDGGSAFDPGQRSQSARSRLGKLLRLDPGDPHAPWEVVATGLRNPWRMAFDPRTTLLWIGDVGQDRVEEVDALALPESGERVPNLGWAAFEGNLPLGRKRLDRRGPLVWPVAGYHHRDGRCSITGGVVYRGSAIPALRGRYVFGDFCAGTIWSLDAGAARGRGARDVRREAARMPALVSFGEDLAGELYAVSVEGRVARLIPTRPVRIRDRSH